MKRYLIVFLLAVYAVAAVSAQSDLQPVALIRLTRSEPITVKQLKSELDKLAWQNLVPTLRRVPTTAEVTKATQSLTVEQRRQVLELMINEKLALQAAERDRIAFTDSELNQQISQLKEQMRQTLGRPPTEDEFAQAIRNETGQDYPVFRDDLKRRATVQKYLMTKKEALFSSIAAPAEAEIANFYNLAKTEFIRPDTIRFSMIQAPHTDAASKTRAKETIDRLAREIGTDPSKFDEAVVKGRAPGSDYQAGDGGYIPRSLQLQQATGNEFMNVAFSLKQGEVSRVIDGIGGYQIVKVTESYPQTALGLDDIVQPGSAVTVRQYISQNLLQQKQQEILARATQELVDELRAGNPFQIMEANLNW